MQGDVFTRVLLVLILAGLAALLAQGFRGKDGSASGRGRFSITVVRAGRSFDVVRTDTQSGEVWRAPVNGQAPWASIGLAGEAADPPPAPPAAAPPEPTPEVPTP
ncbi:MAG: hypothetical protein ABFS46_03010 [Myxococcota bacterium]